MERLTQITFVEKEPHHLLPGEVTYASKHQTWFIGCPGCAGLGSLAGHEVTYKATGELTASPSILCGCGAHYFVRNNQIQWV